MVNASGQLGVAASSKRFKDEIKRMDKASEAILALQTGDFSLQKEVLTAKAVRSLAWWVRKWQR